MDKVLGSTVSENLSNETRDLASPPTIPEAVAEAKPEVSAEQTEDKSDDGQAEATETVADEKAVKTIPYDRFKEVNDAKKALAEENKSMKERIATMESANKPKPKTAVEVFKAKGYDDESAKALAEGFEELLNERLGPINKEFTESKVGQSIAKNIAEFSKSHKDFAEYEGRMTEIFESMDGDEKAVLAKSKRGLEMLYTYAKSQAMPDVMAKAKEDVAKNRVVKKEGASLKGAATAPQEILTGDKIMKMSTSEYLANQEKIHEYLKTRPI